MKISYFTFFNILTFMLVLLGIGAQDSLAFAQRPRNIPDPDKSEPMTLDTLPEIIIYIGLPVLFILLFIWLRRRRRKN